MTAQLAGQSELERSKNFRPRQPHGKKLSALMIGQRKTPNGDTVRSVIARYEAERMPSRHSTARVYRSFLNNHILPKWGDTLIQDVQPRPVELWLRELPLSPKSKTHVRSLMHGLVEFAMWAGLLDISRNPISLVRNIGATRRVRKARSLTAEQFHALLKELHEPFATMALLCVCLGLRISEALALRWADVDWLGSRLSIRRGIVEQIVGDVKTEGSAKTFDLAGELLERLKSWKQPSEFSGAEDWIFASPVKLGRLPYSYTGVWRELVAGIGGGENRAPRDARFPAHLPLMAGRCGHSRCRAAEDDAPRGHQNDHEHLRGCCNG